MKIDVNKVRKNEGFKQALAIFQQEVKDADMSMEQILGFFFSMGIKSAFETLKDEFAE